MNNHQRKKIAPIIITVILLIYYVIYLAFIIACVPTFLKLVLGIIPVCLGGALIYVCIQRLNEIDGGEEDDLSKY